MSESWFKKHIVHSILFIVAGIFMFGSYVTSVEDLNGSPRMGALAALGLIVFGIYLFFYGREMLREKTTFVEYYDAIVMAVGIALVVRTFIIEPFKIPSGSMIPSLLVGDYLFVDKSSYGHRIPFTQKRVFMGDGPKRGDVVVFEYPSDPGKDYIKRIVGLPGDQVVYENKRLYINNKPIPLKDEGAYAYIDERDREVMARRYTERFDGADHELLLQPHRGHDMAVIVPEEHYFVMGDNRDNSNDSRAWGFVPAYRLLGKAVILFWSWDTHGDGWFWDKGNVRWGRLAQPIR
ncbi:signal peptidase I [Magnetococcales bacterium HHB-1]